MPFDWFTVAAQSINFIILLWLLKRFLFKPIIDGLDAREQRLQKVLSAAKLKNTQAEELQQACEAKYQDFEHQRADIMRDTQTEAEKLAKKLTDAAHKAADEMLRKRLKAIQHEMHTLQQQILNRNIDEVYGTAAKMLSDLAGVDLQSAMVNTFIERVGALSKQQLTSLFNALHRANNIILIRSAFALSDQEQQQITQRLTALLVTKNQLELKVKFVLIPNLLAGIELSVSGWKLAWSINHHLQDLEEYVRNAIQIPSLEDDTKPKQCDESAFGKLR